MKSLSPSTADHLAEGTPRDVLLPRVPQMVFEKIEGLHLSDDHEASETGLLMRVVASTEAKESPEVQDAIRSHDETQPSQKIMQPVTAIAQENLMTSTAPILIVEDTVELAEVIQATLEGMGMSVVSATHGKIGLDRLKQSNPKLLLLDIGLPDITGWELLKSVKDHYTQQKRALPPIVVITAFGDPANRLVGKLQDIQGYLIKPFTPEQIENVVKTVLSGEKPPSAHLG
jgi:CheY-like chemotaxis protein